MGRTCQNGSWIGCCTWSSVLCVGSQHVFMLLLEGLHSWTMCKVWEAEKLQLNPSENKQSVYTLRKVVGRSPPLFCQGHESTGFLC